MAKLQNQMFSSFQNRFKGMVDFNSMNQAPQTQTIITDNSASPTNVQSTTKNNTTISVNTKNET